MSCAEARKKRAVTTRLPACVHGGTGLKLASMFPALRFFVAAIFLFAVPLQADKPAQRSDGIYEFRAEHDRDGIGKFYMDREIAHVMGHQAADWLERPEREEEEKPDLLVESIKLKPGDAVADIGCGTGYL